ncbi:MAG: protein-S-isoprenylcysteine O-methyltransferase [Chloroflexota bacterium]
MERLFKILYFAGMGLEVILRLPYARQRRRMPRTERRVSLAERGLLAGLSLAGLLLPLLYSLTGWLDFADYRLSPPARARAGSIGTGFLAAAIWLFWRSHRDLGANWSPSLELGTQHTLITQGVYGVIRHPMYASQGLWGLAQALLLPNWIAGLGGLLSFLLFYLIRVPQEERMMLDHFGDAYRAYCQRTGRIMPRLPG